MVMVSFNAPRRGRFATPTAPGPASGSRFAVRAWAALSWRAIIAGDSHGRDVTQLRHAIRARHPGAAVTQAALGAALISQPLDQQFQRTRLVVRRQFPMPPPIDEADLRQNFDGVKEPAAAGLSAAHAGRRRPIGVRADGQKVLLAIKSGRRECRGLAHRPR